MNLLALLSLVLAADGTPTACGPFVAALASPEWHTSDNPEPGFWRAWVDCLREARAGRAPQLVAALEAADQAELAAPRRPAPERPAMTRGDLVALFGCAVPAANVSTVSAHWFVVGACTAAEAFDETRRGIAPGTPPAQISALAPAMKLWSALEPDRAQQPEPWVALASRHRELVGPLWDHLCDEHPPTFCAQLRSREPYAAMHAERERVQALVEENDAKDRREHDVRGLIGTLVGLVVGAFLIAGAWRQRNAELGKLIAVLTGLVGGAVYGGLVGGLIGARFSDGDTLGGLPIAIGGALGIIPGAIAGALASGSGSSGRRPIVATVCAVPVAALIALVSWY